MGSAIGDLLPSAIGVGISPLAIVAAISMLWTPRPRANGVAFVLGWVGGLISISVIVLTFASPVGVSVDGRESTVGAALRVVLGAGLLGLAYLEWLKRPTPGHKADLPRWMNSPDAMQPQKALELGALMAALNPRNLMLTLAASLAVAESAASAIQTMVLVAVFVFCGSALVVTPVAAYLFAGNRASMALDAARGWLGLNTPALMAGVLMALGLVQCSRGLGGLIANF